MTSSQESTNKRPIYPLVALAAGLVMVVRLAMCVRIFSPATDEPSHIGAAVSMIEAHKLIAPGSHPPLARLVAAIPLWIDGARLPQCRGQTMVGTEDLGYGLGTEVLYDGNKPFMTLLTHARLAMLIFPCIALLYVYLLGRWLAGPLVAMLATIFFSLDPTLLGHGIWVGNDIAGCAGFLVAIYHGLQWLRDASWKNAIIAGIAGGLAVSTKFSCVLALPAIALVALFIKPQWRKLIQQAGVVGLVAFMTLWGTYFFNIGSLGDQEGMNISAAQTPTDNAPAKAMREKWERIPGWIRNTPIPMPSCFLGIARLMLHNHFGHAAYLNGEVRGDGWWYYFPEVFVLKTPLGFLAALLVATIVFVAGRRWTAWPYAAILIPPAIVLASSMASKLDIGVRYLLPAIPFLYLFATMQLARGTLVWLLGILMLFTAIETAVVHPDYMSYFNLAVGGPAHGDRYALDNNLDWNQDVLRLATWIEQNAHGRPYAIRLAGRRNRPILLKLGLDGSALEASPHGRLLFISKNTRLIDGRLPWLWRYQPIAHVGCSIDVYDLTGPAKPDEPDDVPIVDDPWLAPK
jgi:hypothetical protein